MIKDLGELEKLLKLLRAEGVTSFAYETLSIEMGELPQPEQAFIASGEEPQTKLTEAEMAAAVNMPVMGLEDPFIDYSIQVPQE